MRIFHIISLYNNKFLGRNDNIDAVGNITTGFYVSAHIDPMHYVDISDFILQKELHYKK